MSPNQRSHDAQRSRASSLSAHPRFHGTQPSDTTGITLEPDYERALGIRPTVSAVIFDRKGRLLLQQRSDGGQWGLPGGSMEIGESATQAVVREVKEETGLDVRTRRLIGVYSDPALQVVRYPDGNVWHYVSLCFECTVRAGTLTTCDETLALDYFPLHRLPGTLLANHRIRIRDARARRTAAYAR
jgi:ADP-ribose pyrophosphatase YjhB (NUDIX family)